MDFVSAWKAASIGVTAAFGVLGLLSDFRDKTTGKITIFGYISLGGTVISALLGIAAQLMDQSEQDRSRAEAAAQTLQIAKSTNTAVKGIESMLSRIDDPQISLRFQVICDAEMRKFCDASTRNQNAINPNILRSIWSNWPDKPPVQAFHVEIYSDLGEARNRLKDYSGKPDLTYLFTAVNSSFRVEQEEAKGNEILIHNIDGKIFMDVDGNNVIKRYDRRTVIGISDLKGKYALIRSDRVQNLTPISITISSKYGGDVIFDLSDKCEKGLVHINDILPDKDLETAQIYKLENPSNEESIP